MYSCPIRERANHSSQLIRFVRAKTLSRLLKQATHNAKLNLSTFNEASAMERTVLLSAKRSAAEQLIPSDLQLTLSDLFTPAIASYAPLPGIPTELIINILSHMDFYERTRASMICTAFYAAYRGYHVNGSLLQLVLAGDYISFIPAFCRETPERQKTMIASLTFATLMVYAGMPMTLIYSAVMAAATKPAKPTIFYGALIKKYGSLRGLVPDLHTYSSYEAHMLRYHHFEIAEQTIRKAGWLDKLADDTSDDEDMTCDIEWALTSFHRRCVSTTDPCMVHRTHEHLASVIPQFVIDMHSRVEITIPQLYQYISAAQLAHNRHDLLWLQKRYPTIYLSALFYQQERDDEPFLECNIKNITDFGDDVAALNLMDGRGAVYRF
jgi:hypothetical protein